ncbi:MAG: toll/interleukin-1 receptor domain-containing protein [Chloroflexota bacterium]|nr:toll/interleukin-1 receptor domain-containing protein [Chloroflexota bacterium]
MESRTRVQQPITLMYAYAQADAPLRDQLERHLAILRQQGLIRDWSDRQIVPGTDWKQAIETQVRQASLFLVLLSPDFVASDYCFGQEMQEALRRQAAGESLVIPILVHPVDWQRLPFAHLQVLPRSRTPVAQWSDQDEAWAEVVEGISEAIDHLHARSRPSCFIAYAHQDEPFAQRLYDDLHYHGVPCWYAPEDMTIGSKMRHAIEEAIQQRDKVLLILSVHAIESAWVEEEVETAFEIERVHRRLVLFPIRLDETVMHTPHAWAATIRRMRHIGDFRQWQDETAYQRALQRLLRDI